MTSSTAPGPGQPVMATLGSDGMARITFGDTVHTLHGGDLQHARNQVVAFLAQQAAQLGHPILAETHDPTGHWQLLIGPDGSVTPTPVASASSTFNSPTEPIATSGSASPGVSHLSPHDASASPTEPIPKTTDRPLADPEIMDPRLQPAEDLSHFAPFTPPSAPSPTAPPLPVIQQPAPLSPAPRRSFLSHEMAEEPANRGWRGALARLGLRMTPGQSERLEREDILAVSKHWVGPRTIAVVNGKGGASKTPTTILLAAVFARNSGSGVLAWDNNQTRGTLGWRTEQANHHSTLLELLPQADYLLSPNARAADLANFVHHQTRDRYDVLRSKPTDLASAQRISARDVDAIHQVAAKYYRIIFIDSGNDESDPMWQRMIDHADQLVVATTTRDDHAEAGALLLEALAQRDEHASQLAASSVVVVNQASPSAKPTELIRVAEGYHHLAREAVIIPYDQAMVDGHLLFGNLQPKTQRAWLAAGAAVARGL